MNRAAIIGGGVIGGGWAARFLLNGWDVAVFDRDPEAERKIGAVVDQARWALPMLYDRQLPREGRLTFCESIEKAVSGAEYIQESVPERLDLKHRVFAEIEAANRDAPIGSSTSGFKPSDLRDGMATGARLAVAHPFNPVYLLPLVEVVAGDGDASALSDVLRRIGMYPLEITAEIDAHIADRLLEAVWREALWLVNDGIATTGDIDDAIRYGFGLRWAQMGLFETYRIAGGEGGMAHFIRQFGPALKWPWTKLTDVPELTDELAERIGAQSDAQSGNMSLRALERLRDTNLVAILRALRARGSAAGALIAEHEATLPESNKGDVPLVTVRRVIPVDWTDYNGHMNEGRYGQVFSDAADALMAAVGADQAYIDAGLSFFTVETSIRYLLETHAGEAVRCETRVVMVDGRKLKLAHRMLREADDAELATCDQFLLHVSLDTRKSCEPRADVAEAMAQLAARHRQAA